MSDRHKVRHERITVGKTKVAKNPWEEDRYVYNIKTGDDSLFSSNIWIFLVQIIVGIFAFIYFWNTQSRDASSYINDPNFKSSHPATRDWKPLNQQ